MTTRTEAQKKADKKYRESKVKRILLEFYPTEQELWDKVQEQPNKQGYIKQLIKRDIIP